MANGIVDDIQEMVNKLDQTISQAVRSATGQPDVERKIQHTQVQQGAPYNNPNQNGQNPNPYQNSAPGPNGQYQNNQYQNNQYQNTQAKNGQGPNGQYQNPPYQNTGNNGAGGAPRYQNTQYTNAQNQNTQFTNGQPQNNRNQYTQYQNTKYQNFQRTNAYGTYQNPYGNPQRPNPTYGQNTYRGTGTYQNTTTYANGPYRDPGNVYQGGQRQQFSQMKTRAREFFQGTPHPQTALQKSVNFTGKKVGSMIGIVFISFFLFPILIMELILAFSGVAAAAMGMLPLAIGLTVADIKLISNASQYTRFDTLLNATQGKLYLHLGELSSDTGIDKKTIVKDYQSLIAQGVYPQGHLDEQGGYLLLSNETYQQYRQSMQSHIARNTQYATDNRSFYAGAAPQQKNTASRAQQAESIKRPVEPGAKSAAANTEKQNTTQRTATDPVITDPEVIKAVALSEDFTRQIRKANNAMPEEKITGILLKMETLTTQVFNYVKVHPEMIHMTDKMLQYYLPTTMKLIGSYQEFESQPVQFENMDKAKSDIRQTLEMINTAFEQILQSMYQQSAMEVSADASVLQNMLKQAGLAGSDFDAVKNAGQE